MQMPEVGHRYVAEIQREGARTLTAAIDADWIPAVECGRFQFVRDDCAPEMNGAQRPRIRPAWNAVTGPPYVSHVEVFFPRNGPQIIPLQYFAEPVSQAVSALVKEGRIEAGETYRWRVQAYPVQGDRAASSDDDAFVVEESDDDDSALPRISLDARWARARYCGPADGEGRDVPVFLSRRLLSEASERAIAAGNLEAGGILVGGLVRDIATGDLALVVAAQIAAREAIASDASLRFTPETWQAADSAIRLRGGDEKAIGWWHSHPRTVWACANCPPDRRSKCPSNRAFFSTMDVHVHRTVFPAAQNIALLLSFHEHKQPRFDLFGWRDGMVSARGYYLEDEP